MPLRSQYKSLIVLTGKKIIRTIQYIIFIAGIPALLLFILSFSTVPFRFYYWLGTSKTGTMNAPDYIVFLGGGGMPEPSNLMRAYYTKEVADNYPEAEIILALPGDTTDNNSSVNKLTYYISESIDYPRYIWIEPDGRNTREQAIHCKSLIADPDSQVVLLITSPGHMRRAIMCFQKTGIKNVNGIPAFEEAIESNLLFEDNKLGSRNIVPDLGGNLMVRYEFWTQLHYEITVLREFCALFYYKLKGWI